MKVVIVDHPKILGFLLRMYYSKSKRRASLTKKAAEFLAAFFVFLSLTYHMIMRMKRKIALFFYLWYSDKST